MVKQKGMSREVEQRRQQALDRIRLDQELRDKGIVRKVTQKRQLVSK